MGEISRGDTSDIEDVSLGWLEEVILVEQYLEEFHGDVMMVSAAPSIGRTDPFVPSLLTQHPFHPLSFSSPPFMFMHFMSP